MMEPMTKERLKNYRWLRDELGQLSARLAECEAGLFAPKAQRLSGMPSAPSKGNAMEDMAVRHMQLQALYQRRCDELAAELLAIEAAIESLDPTARLLCRWRYIDGLPWKQVCERMNYSWSQVHNLHRHALDVLRAGE